MQFQKELADVQCQVLRSSRNKVRWGCTGEETDGLRPWGDAECVQLKGCNDSSKPLDVKGGVMSASWWGRCTVVGAGPWGLHAGFQGSAGGRPLASVRFRADN